MNFKGFVFCLICLQSGLALGSDVKPKKKIRKERSAAVLEAEQVEAIARNKQAKRAMLPSSTDWSYKETTIIFGSQATTQMIVDKVMGKDSRYEIIENLKKVMQSKKRKHSLFNLESDEYVTMDIVQKSVDEMMNIIETQDDQK